MWYISINCLPLPYINNIQESSFFFFLILKWIAISSSRGSSRPRDRTLPLLHWQAGSLALVPPGKPYPGIFSKSLLKSNSLKAREFMSFLSLGNKETNENT